MHINGRVILITDKYTYIYFQALVFIGKEMKPSLDINFAKLMMKEQITIGSQSRQMN